MTGLQAGETGLYGCHDSPEYAVDEHREKIQQFTSGLFHNVGRVAMIHYKHYFILIL